MDNMITSAPEKSQLYDLIRAVEPEDYCWAMEATADREIYNDNSGQTPVVKPQGSRLGLGTERHGIPLRTRNYFGRLFTF